MDDKEDIRRGVRGAQVRESGVEFNETTAITNIQKDTNSQKLFRASSGIERLGDDVEAVFFSKRRLKSSSLR